MKNYTGKHNEATDNVYYKTPLLRNWIDLSFGKFERVDTHFIEI